MDRRHLAGLLLASATLVACSAQSQTSEAERICDDLVADYGADFSVAGAFPSTVGAIRALLGAEVSPRRWPAASSDEPATLCYIDGPFSKAPPPDAHLGSYDRGAIGVWHGGIEALMLGYQSSMAIRAP